MTDNELKHINRVLSIPIAYGLRIAVSKDNPRDGIEQLFISIETEEGEWHQDICCVRPHWDVLEDTINTGLIDCMVYADSDDEDYTNKYVVGIYRDEDDIEGLPF